MASLTPEQKQAVASWVAAGDSLSNIQQKLREQFQLSLTYMDVRFLIDDLDLQVKDAAPKADASDVSKTPARPAAPAGGEKKGLFDQAKEKLGLGDKPGESDDEDPAAELADEEFDDLPAGDGSVRVTVDSVTLIPGAMASGTVAFSDGVTGKWIVDNYGRPGFTEISQPGYRPNPADAQAFMHELNRALQQKGL
jgi:hypothetical protein